MVTVVCDDCLMDVIAAFEYFMLKDGVWRYIANPEEILCVGCVEERLGRPLTPEDFAEVPCNHMPNRFPKSDRLRNRMGIQ